MATVGCIAAGCLTFLVGIPFGYLGAIVRYYYGPDSVYATFDPDTCSTILGLPTCGYWGREVVFSLRLSVIIVGTCWGSRKE